MLEELRSNWGWIALRGVFAVLFGLMALLWPAITLTALILLWGAFQLTDGVVSLVTGVRVHDGSKPFLPIALVGVVGIAVGLVTLFWPALTTFALLMVIGSCALLTGILQVVAAIRLREEIEDEWLLAFGGVVSMLFGLVMIVQPGPAAVGLVWMIGAYAIFFGLLLITLGLRLRGSAASRLTNA
jgi:uncharacterized membrane protein HdeD (DUF308 family)